ncbi:MAG: hypothetical protein ABIY50_08760 [Ignavibacteria bacterium]
MPDNKSGESFLEKCLSLFECYTSVVNASEIFSRCSSKEEIEVAKKYFLGVSVLGIPFRYSVTAGEILKETEIKSNSSNLRDSLIMTMCVETKLPMITLNENRYIHLSERFNVKLISKEIIIQNNSPEIIFKKAKILI